MRVLPALALLACGGSPAPFSPGADLAVPADASSGGGPDAAGSDAAAPADLLAADPWSTTLPSSAASAFAQQFFLTYCTSCHGTNTADTRRDYTQYSQVLRDAMTIACGVAPVSMPVANCPTFPPAGQFPIGTGPKPTDVERERIVQWIQNGLPM
jgi:hypothetical protein